MRALAVLCLCAMLGGCMLADPNEHGGDWARVAQAACGQTGLPPQVAAQKNSDAARTAPAALFF